MMRHKSVLLASCLVACVFIAGCKDPVGSVLPTTGKAHIELPAKLQEQMKQQNMAKNSAILVRIFKEESTLEVWKQRRDGKYALISSYDICTWSGKLGPKFIEGDRQAPEGFYSVRPAQMNPNSQYYLAFNIGYPNAYDQANGRTGKHLMVHGACSSAGCYSMSDENIAEIYAFARDSFKGGQREFQVQAFPFRMTAANMARYAGDPNMPFWRVLKQGYDFFEVTHQPPQVDVCEKRYVFNARGADNKPLSPLAACPAAGGDLALSFKEESSAPNSVLAALSGGRKKAPTPSIQGLEEARLVADWSRRRARGEKVSREPPSLSQNSAQPAGEISSPAPVPVSASAQAGEANISAVPASTSQVSPQDSPIVQKKKGLSLFRSKS